MRSTGKSADKDLLQLICRGDERAVVSRKASLEKLRVAAAWLCARAEVD